MNKQELINKIVDFCNFEQVTVEDYPNFDELSKKFDIVIGRDIIDVFNQECFDYRVG